MSAFSINTATLLVACFYSASFGALAAHRRLNGQLKSVNSYPGACPYSSAGNGTHCRARSAYSRSGGYNVLCYPTNITKGVLQE